jgi:hypothetical protein
MGNGRVFFRFAITSDMRCFAAIVAGLLTVPLLFVGQGLPPRDASLLLPETQRVSGVVGDSSGEPISGGSIQHLGQQTNSVVTDSNGRFEFSTRVPAFVIRKNGYESAFIRTESAHSIHITLKQSEAKISTCSSKSECTTAGWGTVFCFPNVKGVTRSDQINDIDYGNRSYSVKSEHGRQAMTHGGGPMWGIGKPFDEDVWSSIEYSEKTYRYDSEFTDINFIVDARGKTKEGKYWRFVGKFGETAAYHDVDQESAALFDLVLDSVCIKESPRK